MRFSPNELTGFRVGTLLPSRMNILNNMPTKQLSKKDDSRLISYQTKRLTEGCPLICASQTSIALAFLGSSQACFRHESQSGTYIKYILK